MGVGGSGGAIQQYVYAQNHPGLLDAAIPQYSYSDMITQTIHVGDCELLEHYFDVTDRTNNKWDDVLNRRAIQGLNASRDAQHERERGGAVEPDLRDLLAARPEPAAADPAGATTAAALTECRRAWFGLTPLALNPTFTNVADLDKLAQGAAGVDWTHAGDLVNIYGIDGTGFARNAVGQRGRAVRPRRRCVDGTITPAEFLDLNAQVGSWKEPRGDGGRGLPLRRRLQPGELRPVERAQHEPQPRRRRHPGAAPRAATSTR